MNRTLSYVLPHRLSLGEWLPGAARQPTEATATRIRASGRAVHGAASSSSPRALPRPFPLERQRDAAAESFPLARQGQRRSLRLNPALVWSLISWNIICRDRCNGPPLKMGTGSFIWRPIGAESGSILAKRKTVEHGATRDTRTVGISGRRVYRL